MVVLDAGKDLSVVLDHVSRHSMAQPLTRRVLPMIALFVDVLLPVLLVAGAGWVLSARLRIDPRPLNRAVFYLFVPCLVFRIVVDSDLDAAAVARMAAFAWVALGIPALVAFGIARALRWGRARTAAVVLVVLLPNAGNLGLPVTRFAFGEDGLAHAGVFFVSSSVLTYTVGVFVASVGRASWVTALARLPRVPAVWSVLLAGVIIATDVTIPTPLRRSVDLLADATIPTFLIVLGMQLQGRVVRGAFGPIALAGAARLLGGIVAGYAAAIGFGLEGSAYRAGLVESAMPSAVASVVLATEFDLEPRLVTSVVMVTTLACPLTVTPLLSFLNG